MSAEDARERGELQRAYYSLLHATTHNELTGALLAAPAATRDAALEGLVRGAASHVDAIVRKTCMQARFARVVVTPCPTPPAPQSSFVRSPACDATQILVQRCLQASLSLQT